MSKGDYKCIAYEQNKGLANGKSVSHNRAIMKTYWVKRADADQDPTLKLS